MGFVCALTSTKVRGVNGQLVEQDVGFFLVSLEGSLWLSERRLSVVILGSW